MAAADNASHVPTAAPWRDLFVKHLATMPVATFSLATLHHTPAAGSSGDGSTAAEAAPRVRTCVFRGLFGSLPANDRNPAQRNPAVFESELPVLTTDARMDKVGEILLDGSGGGQVEAVWWAEEPATQWRVRGTAWLLGPDIDGDGDGARAAREVLRRRMRRRKDNAEDNEWSWSREVTAHFGNLSPVMRGSFRNPPPGTPVADPATPVGPGLGLGQTVDDLDDPVARANFRVVVIVPTEVDQADLSDPKRARRWLYVYRGGASHKPKPALPGGEVIGEWEKVEVWP